MRVLVPFKKAHKWMQIDTGGSGYSAPRQPTSCPWGKPSTTPRVHEWHRIPPPSPCHSWRLEPHWWQSLWLSWCKTSEDPAVPLRVSSRTPFVHWLLFPLQVSCKCLLLMWLQLLQHCLIPCCSHLNLLQETLAFHSHHGHLLLKQLQLIPAFPCPHVYCHCQPFVSGGMSFCTLGSDRSMLSSFCNEVVCISLSLASMPSVCPLTKPRSAGVEGGSGGDTFAVFAFLDFPPLRFFTACFNLLRLNSLCMGSVGPPYEGFRLSSSRSVAAGKQMTANWVGIPRPTIWTPTQTNVLLSEGRRWLQRTSVGVVSEDSTTCSCFTPNFLDSLDAFGFQLTSFLALFLNLPLPLSFAQSCISVLSALSFSLFLRTNQSSESGERFAMSSPTAGWSPAFLVTHSDTNLAHGGPNGAVIPSLAWLTLLAGGFFKKVSCRSSPTAFAIATPASASG